MSNRLLFVFLFWILRISLAQIICNSVPISLSSFDNCENDYCIYDTAAAAALPDIPGSSLCLEFIPPGALVNSTTVNVTLESAHYLFTSELSYHDDDPATDFQYHHCCAGSLENCGYDQVSVAFTDIVYRGHLNHRSQDCALSALGINSVLYWKLGISTLKRFKFTKYNKTPLPLATFLMFAPNATLALEWSGDVKSIKDNISDTEFIVTSYSGTQPVIPDYSVFDHQAASDFYMIDAADISGLGACTFSKIGCFAKNSNYTTDDPHVRDAISVDLRNPKDSAGSFLFSNSYPWSDVSSRLPQYKLRLANTYLPKSRLMDPDYASTTNDYTTQPDHNVLGFTVPLAYGWIIITSDGSARYFGVDIKGFQYPDPDLGTLYEDTTTATLSNGSTIVVSGTLATRCNEILTYDYSSNKKIVLRFCHFEADPTLYFVCAGNLTYMQNNLGICTGWQVTVQVWPDFTLKKISYTGIFNSVLSQEVSNTSPYLLVPMSKGTFQVLAKVHNKKVYFKETLVRPEMRNVQSNLSHITFEARSVGSKGDCYLSTIPAQLLVSNPDIYLTNSWEIGSVELNSGYATTNGSLYLSCFKYVVSGKFDLSYNNEVNGANKEFEDFQFSDFSTSQNWWDAFRSSFGFGSVSTTTWHKLFIYLIVVCVIAVLALLIYLFINYILPLMFAMRLTMPRRQTTKVSAQDFLKKYR